MTAMLLNSTVVRARVERFLLGIVDRDIDASPAPWPSDLSPVDEPVYARTNRIDLRSVAADHYATVALESWDGGPDDPDGEWEDDHYLQLSLTSGELEVVELTGGPAGSFTVGSPGEYAVSVHVAGRSELLSRYLATPSAIADGVERYLVRFWPA
jgi:hypothetical protein